MIPVDSELTQMIAWLSRDKLDSWLKHKLEAVQDLKRANPFWTMEQ